MQAQYRHAWLLPRQAAPIPRVTMWYRRMAEGRKVTRVWTRTLLMTLPLPSCDGPGRCPQEADRVASSHLALPHAESLSPTDHIPNREKRAPSSFGPYLLLRCIVEGRSCLRRGSWAVAQRCLGLVTNTLLCPLSGAGLGSTSLTAQGSCPLQGHGDQSGPTAGAPQLLQQRRAVGSYQATTNKTDLTHSCLCMW